MASHGRTTPSQGRPRQQPAANYLIIQTFVSFSEQPQVPFILRVDPTLSVEDVIQQALSKYNEALGTADYDKVAMATYAPPSTSPGDYILRVARADGVPDRGAPPLDRRGLVREQGLLFPFMLVLSLDPNKDVQQMQLTDAFKAQLLSRTNNKDNKRDDHDADSIASSDIPPGPPEDAQPSQSALEVEANARETYIRTKTRAEELEARRRDNITKKEKERQERDRAHLESCAKRERARQHQLAEEKKAEETRQLEQLEESYKQEMQRKMDQLVQEQKQREMLEAQKKELEREEAERRRRHLALEKERLLRNQAKQETEAQAKAERQLLRDIGRAQRMDDTLNYIVAKLHNEISSDNQARVEMLEQERVERQAAEREAFEREYVSRIERQQRQRREEENIRQMELDAKRQAWQEQQDRQKAAAEAEKQAKLEAEKEQWKVKFRQEKDKVRRQRQLQRLGLAEAADTEVEKVLAPVAATAAAAV